MMPAVAAAPPGRSIATLPSVRLVACVAALVVGSWVMVERFEAGLAAIIAVWLVAAPFCLGPLRPAWRAELPGAVCFFTVAGSVYFVDQWIGARYDVVVVFLALGGVYLLRRPTETRRLVRSPILIALAAFLLMQLASAYLAGAPELSQRIRERAFMFLFVLCTAVLTRRPGGKWLVPALLVLCTLASVPVILRELAEPFPDMWGRAGGLHHQANVAGIMFSFGLAAAGALHVEGLLSGGAFAALALGFFVGFLGTASRGGLINAAVALVITFGGRFLVARRSARGLAVAAVAAIALSQLPLSAELMRATNELESAGFGNVERLQEIVLALTGSSDAADDVMANDSNRIGIASDAVALIERRPLFGYGTGVFRQYCRSHVEFLEVLGENGVVGALFYLAVLGVVARAVLRLPPRPRLSAAIFVGPWLVTHFHNHNLAEATQLNIALAYVAGLSDWHTAPATGTA
jgi:hypothetical protein